MISARLAALAVVGLFPSAAMAQNVEAKFWLKGAPGNITGCIAADPSFTRQHTFTLINGQAEIKSAGGIDVKLKPIRPNVYQGHFNLGRMDLTYTADLAVTPATLVVTNEDLGCKWNGVKE